MTWFHLSVALSRDAHCSPLNSAWMFLQDLSEAFSCALATNAGLNRSVLTMLEKDLCLSDSDNAKICGST